METIFQKVYNHSQRKAEPRKWIYDIDPIFPDNGPRLHMASCTEQEAEIYMPFCHREYYEKENWRRNVFVCMKEYGVMRRVGKIQIIHSIGQRVNFAKGVDNICMNILI